MRPQAQNRPQAPLCDDDAKAKGLFVTDAGEQVKFFLQAELSDAIKEELNRDIITNGGRVTEKVPLQGFVLIDPRSHGGQRLVTRWRTADKPDRRVVPTTFVRACIQHQGILPPIFAHHHVPLLMHLHGSIQDQSARDRAYERIWHSGGDPTSSAANAEVIIVDDDEDTRAAVRLEYAGRQPPVRVEALSWVKHCANSGKCRFSPLTTKSRKANGSGRHEYTPADDYNLVAYLARMHPDKTKPGRSGNKLYKDLCEDLDKYPWAGRHPWASWRERYIKNRDSFDIRIDDYREEHDSLPSTHEDAQEKPKRVRKKRLRRHRHATPDEASNAEEDTAPDAEPESDHGLPPNAAQHEPAPSDPGPAAAPVANAARSKSSVLTSSPSRRPLKRSASRDSWGSQWDVRVAPEDDRPDWAKRGHKRNAAEAEVDDSSHVKKVRRDEQELALNSAPSAAPNTARLPSPQAGPNADDSVTEDSASEAEANAVDAIARPPGGNEDLTQTQDTSDATQSDAVGETQQLLAAHNAIVSGQRNSRQPIAGPSHLGEDLEDIDAKLAAIAQKHRFYLQDVVEVYDRINDLAKTNRIFSEMRSAADAVLELYGIPH